VGTITPAWCRRDNVVQHGQQMIQVTNLGVAGGVFAVGFLRRNLLEHRSEEHVESGVILDHGLELLDHGREFLGIVVDVVGDMGQPCFLDTMVCGQPTADSIDRSVGFLSGRFEDGVPLPVHMMLLGNVWLMVFGNVWHDDPLCALAYLTKLQCWTEEQGGVRAVFVGLTSWCIAR